MPVIVIGADSTHGMSILKGLYEPEREIRAFVTDDEVGAELKELGFKVALGDVTDESHVEAAAMRCHSAILIAEAASDDRERSFAHDPAEVLELWERAMLGASVNRVIWVSGGTPPATRANEVAVVDPNHPKLVEAVVDLDDAQAIS